MENMLQKNLKKNPLGVKENTIFQFTFDNFIFLCKLRYQVALENSKKNSEIFKSVSALHNM